ncbi:hypothetical protein Ancab_027542 [Ancistrocladus abbreviatus]
MQNVQLITSSRIVAKPGHKIFRSQIYLSQNLQTPSLLVLRNIEEELPCFMRKGEADHAFPLFEGATETGTDQEMVSGAIRTASEVHQFDVGDHGIIDGVQ